MGIQTSRPFWEYGMSEEKLIRQQLNFVYGSEGEQIWFDLQKLIGDFQSRNPDLVGAEFSPNEKDVVLITYGDQFQEKGRRHLGSLFDFLHNELEETINWVHILPFFPYSSDDGFSVIDYRQVDPDLGTWEDISTLADEFHLMFDAVINHISRESIWFNAFKRNEKPYKDYFITVDPSVDLSSIFRPRALPLLTPVETSRGDLHVWTTFSSDQIDLNYANPQLLYEIIDLLLFYVEHGARLIRLDAIGYVWKSIGTSSLNLPQAHSLVKIIRGVLNIAAPFTGIITETNVPHEENIKCFGDPVEESNHTGIAKNGDEAQMVYQFSLAPLILHTFTSGDVTVLTQWAHTLSTPYQNSTFFNFIASHDGIGVMPAKGLLTDDDIQTLFDRTLLHGGEVSYKTNSDGSKSVYELNITLFDALTDPANENPDLDVKRFLASQALMLSFPGVPGIYIHSLFGSRNCLSCVDETGRARSINREKFDLNDLRSKLNDLDNMHTKVFRGYKKLLKIRRNQPAFHPGAHHKVIESNPQVFTFLRSDNTGEQNILCLINVSSEDQEVIVDQKSLDLRSVDFILDLVENKTYTPDNGQINILMEGYQYMWLLIDF
jgi:sucrose phosphorylase